MPAIKFTAKPYLINSRTILLLPKAASANLPSRSQVMVEGTINGHPFNASLEPDGNWSHWFEIDKALKKAAQIEPNKEVAVIISPMSTWPEPLLPADIAQALQGHPKALALWTTVTPMARWEWVRWIRSTANPQTRQRRIAVACSKLEAGKRRPCCWNRNACSVPEVSKNGMLLTANSFAS